MGNAAGIVLFGLLILLMAFRKGICGGVASLWKRKAGKVLLILAGALCGVCAGFCVFFSANMIRYAAEDTQTADCVIVLGCKVTDGEPGRMLTARLEKALELLEGNPEAMCIVSGGKGTDESVSEAEAMEKWLVRRGIAEPRIIKEERSTSTDETMRFCAEIIEQNGITGTITAVTNDFHQYRADIFAQRAGLSVSHASASSSCYSILNYVLREWLALAAALFL